MGWAVKARDPQTFTISTRPHNPQPCTALHELCSAGPHPQGLPHWRYKHAQSLFCWAMTPKPVQPFRSSILLGHTPQPCTISTLLAMPPRPAQPCTIFTPQTCALRPAKLGTHMCTISIVLDHALQACQARDPQTRRISTLPTCTLQACQAHAPKATTSPQLKASTCRPVGPRPLSTCHRKAPNLPKIHTHTNRSGW
jgi:hypothetical protein